jgi:NhaP-type Na+/H+ or K+/H+ antiporter
MSGLAISYSIAAFALLAATLFAPYIKNRLYISEPVIFILLGIVVGPQAARFISISNMTADPNGLLEEVARVTLAISVAGAGLRLPHGYFRQRWGEITLVLSLGMALMWGASTLLTYLILGLAPLMALLTGAIITATDPVLAGTIVLGSLAERCIPCRLRHTLTAESGPNDGLALLLVMIPIYLLTLPAGEAAQRWLLHTLLWQIVLAAGIGIGLGLIAGLGLRWIGRGPYEEEVSLLTVSLGLNLTALIMIRGLGGSGILGSFVAAAVFSRFLSAGNVLEEHRLQEAMGRIFELPMFFLFGLALPWEAWSQLGWRAYVFAASVLVLRRMPVWLLLYPLLPSLHKGRDALFNGWFGPVGISALFYVTFAADRVHGLSLWPVVSLVVFISALVHGITGTPLSKWLGPKLR